MNLLMTLPLPDGHGRAHQISGAGQSSQGQPWCIRNFDSDRRISVKYGTAHFWIIPSQVNERRRVQAAAPRGRDSFEIEFRQQY